MPDPYQFPPRGRRDNPLAEIQMVFDKVRGAFAQRGPSRVSPWLIVALIIKPPVTQILKEEFGFRTVSVGPPARYQDVDAEALMLTGDENIVKLQFIVQFKVKTGPTGATDFLFNVREFLVGGWCAGRGWTVAGIGTGLI
jgi:hypothetical protein